MISRRDLGELSKMVIYFLLAFTPYLHPSNKNRYKKIDIIPNLFQTDSKPIPKIVVYFWDGLTVC